MNNLEWVTAIALVASWIALALTIVILHDTRRQLWRERGRNK